MSAVTLHEMAMSRLPIGLECSHCVRHALITKQTVKATFGDGRTLDRIGLYCSGCGSRTFTVTRFIRQSEIRSFMRNH